MPAFMAVLRVVLVALRSHRGLRFTSLFRTLRQANPTDLR
jgi:hypothetical protein